MSNFKIILDFFTKTFWGILCLSIIGSLIAAILIFFRKIISLRLQKSYAWLAFKEGYENRNAEYNTFRESIITTRFIVRMLTSTIVIIVLSTVVIIFLHLLPANRVWIPITIYFLILILVLLRIKILILHFKFLFILKFEDNKKLK